MFAAYKLQTHPESIYYRNHVPDVNLTDEGAEVNVGFYSTAVYFIWYLAWFIRHYA